MHTTLQSYAQLNARPSVSFAEHSADSPLPVQAFLSQMEFTEDGNLRVICMSEVDHSQLGRAVDFTSNTLRWPKYGPVYSFRPNCPFWGFSG